MTPEDIFAKTLKVYSSCSSYKDFGKIEIFGPASGELSFDCEIPNSLFDFNAKEIK